MSEPRCATCGAEPLAVDDAHPDHPDVLCPACGWQPMAQEDAES